MYHVAIRSQMCVGNEYNWNPPPERVLMRGYFI